MDVVVLDVEVVDVPVLVVTPALPVCDAKRHEQALLYSPGVSQLDAYAGTGWTGLAI